MWLIDHTFQEIATCRTRQNVEDKRMISDSTSRGLRMLAAPSRVYRPRPTRVGPPPSSAALRRSLGLNMTDHITTLPIEDPTADEDGDSTDSALDPAGAAEGARLHSDLWEAMVSGPSCVFFPPNHISSLFAQFCCSIRPIPLAGFYPPRHAQHGLALSTATRASAPRPTRPRRIRPSQSNATRTLALAVWRARITTCRPLG